MSDAAMVRAARRLIARWPHARDEALGVLNGALGDRLHARDASLAQPMALFERDERNGALQEATPARLGLGPRLPWVLLVHGLMGSQHAWTLGTADAPGGAPTVRDEPGACRELGVAVGHALEARALYLRYNTGRHVSDNGRALAARLEALATADLGAPRYVLAHSMGGLVVRSALHYGLQAGHRWPQAVQRVVLLGTPSHGAPLEQLAHVAAFTLETIWNPWTWAIGKFINLRAAGIKDLRHGFCLEEDWRHKDQDVLRLQAPRPTRVPPQVRWYVAAGTRGQPDHWVSRVLGDGLVRAPSARGRGFGTPAPGVLPPARVRIFERTSHLGLTHDPVVQQQVIEWLTGP